MFNEQIHTSVLSNNKSIMFDHFHIYQHVWLIAEDAGDICQHGQQFAGSLAHISIWLWRAVALSHGDFPQFISCCILYDFI